jgi:hypothetical protein
MRPTIDLAPARANAPSQHFETIFETDAWRQYVEATLPVRYTPRTLALASGRRVTIAAYELERRFGHWRVLCSIPPYYYGSLRGDAPLTTADMVDLAGQLQHDPGLHSLTVALHPLDGCAPLATAAWQPYVQSRTATHVLELPGPAVTDLTAWLSGSQRRKMHKAEQRGVTVARADDAASLERYYGVYLASAARWGLVSVEPLKNLERLRTGLAPYYTLWLAWAEHQVIGGLLILSHGATAFVFHESSLAAYWNRFPNNLLYGAALVAAQAEGRRYMDFLPSNNSAGIEEFKESLGAQRSPFNVYCIPNIWYAAVRRLKHRWLDHAAPAPHGDLP